MCVLCSHYKAHLGQPWPRPAALPLPGAGAAHLGVHHHGEPGGEIRDGGVDEVLAGVAATQCGDVAAVCHPAGHLHSEVQFWQVY